MYHFDTIPELQARRCTLLFGGKVSMKCSLYLHYSYPVLEDVKYFERLIHLRGLSYHISSPVS